MRRIGVVAAPFAALALGAVAYHWLADARSVRALDDPWSYLTLRDTPVFSRQFFDGLHRSWRPYTVPLAFGVLKTDARIFAFQKWLSFLAWSFFAWSVASRMAHRRWRVVVALLIAAEMVSEGILNWHFHLVSESIAISLVLLWLGVLIRFDWVLQRPLALVGVAALASLTSNARDTNMYLMPFSLLLIGHHWRRQRTRAATGAALAALAILAAVLVHQSRDARAMMRMVPPLNDVVYCRINPTDRFRQFFVDRGMPVPATLPNQEDIHQLALDPKRLETAAWRPYVEFLRDHGARVYLWFALRHRWYGAKDPFKNRDLILDGLRDADRPRYRDYLQSGLVELRHPSAPVQAVARVIQRIPLDPLVVAAVVALIAIAWRKRRAVFDDTLLVAGVTLFLAGLSNGWISYLGDVDETWRHCLIAGLLFKHGCLLTLLAAAHSNGSADANQAAQ